MSNKKPKENANNEAIIQIQSLMLVLLSMAGLIASDTIIACFNALTNASSAAYIITDNAVVTETQTISIEQCQSIVNNFEFVSYCVFTIGLIIFISSTIRILKKLI
jgi:hypothetical protein